MNDLDAVDIMVITLSLGLVTGLSVGAIRAERRQCRLEQEQLEAQRRELLSRMRAADPHRGLKLINGGKS